MEGDVTLLRELLRVQQCLAWACVSHCRLCRQLLHAVHSASTLCPTTHVFSIRQASRDVVKAPA